MNSNGFSSPNHVKTNKIHESYGFQTTLWNQGIHGFCWILHGLVTCTSPNHVKTNKIHEFQWFFFTKPCTNQQIHESYGFQTTPWNQGIHGSVGFYMVW